MTVYATYEYYEGTFAGTIIASEDFIALAKRASILIDRFTFGRTAPVILAAVDIATIDLIKMATCAVAEELQRIANSGSNGGGIKSESIGANSVTYADNAYATLSDIQKLSDAAVMYLASTHLMYKGFAEGEYADIPRTHRSWTEM